MEKFCEHSSSCIMLPAMPCFWLKGVLHSGRMSSRKRKRLTSDSAGLEGAAQSGSPAKRQESLSKRLLPVDSAGLKTAAVQGQLGVQ